MVSGTHSRSLSSYRIKHQKPYIRLYFQVDVANKILYCVGDRSPQPLSFQRSPDTWFKKQRKSPQPPPQFPIKSRKSHIIPSLVKFTCCKADVAVHQRWVIWGVLNESHELPHPLITSYYYLMVKHSTPWNNVNEGSLLQWNLPHRRSLNASLK